MPWFSFVGHVKFLESGFLVEKTPVDILKFTIFVVADVIVSVVLFFMEMEYKTQFIYILFCLKFILLLWFNRFPERVSRYEVAFFSLAVLDVCSIMLAGAFSVFSLVMSLL